MPVALGLLGISFLLNIVLLYLTVVFYRQGNALLEEQARLELALEDSGLVWSDTDEDEDIEGIVPIVFDLDYEGEEPVDMTEFDRIEAIGELKRNRWDSSPDV